MNLPVRGKDFYRIQDNAVSYINKNKIHLVEHVRGLTWKITISDRYFTVAFTSTKEVEQFINWLCDIEESEE